MHPWESDSEIDASQARALIAAHFPDLAALAVTRLSAGWDNVVYRVGEELVFRFPRREMGAQLLTHELRILPALEHALPCPIPEVKHVAAASPAFGWPFAGYRYLPGETACRLDLSDRQRIPLARPVASFLRALHATPVAATTLERAPHRKRSRSARTLERVRDRARRHVLAPLAARASWHIPGLTGDAIGRMALGRRSARTLQRLRSLEERGLLTEASRFVRLLTAPASDRPLCLVHGDLYARHVLVQDGALAGIIDWGDAHYGESACDLAVAWSFLPPAAWQEFEDAYGEISTITRRRAIARALHHGAALAEFAHNTSDTALIREVNRVFAQIGEHFA